MATTSEDVWRLLADLTAAQKETDKQLKETDKQLKEVSQQQKETELLLAKKLEVKPRTQRSPMLEKNCWLLSGDESYEKSAQKIKSLTGIAVSHSTQQRLVHR